MEENTKDNIAQTVADLAKEYYAANTHEFVSNDGVKTEVMVLPEGKDIYSLKKFFDENRTQPERRKGTATLLDLKSFIAHVLRFKDADSVLFANNDRKAPAITAVYDYNKQGEYGVAAPRFGEHRGHYAFPLSDEWKLWQENNGKRMSQKDFAEFLENNITDIIVPGDGNTSDKVKEFAKLLGGEFASPSQLVALSRGLEVNEGLKVKGAVNLSSGETTIQYISEHQDSSGAPLKVPNLFMVAVPVFVSGELYQVAIRLRYRIQNGSVAWFYDLYRDDKVFEHAFEEACKKAADQTAVPLFIGSSEK